MSSVRIKDYRSETLTNGITGREMAKSFGNLDDRASNRSTFDTDEIPDVRHCCLKLLI